MSRSLDGNMNHIWNYGPELHMSDIALRDFDVVATDGKVGSIVEANSSVDNAFITIQTGRWPIRKNRVIPGRAVTCIDIDARRVDVALAKSQVTDAPQVDEAWQQRDDLRDQLATYYAPFLP